MDLFTHIVLGSAVGGLIASKHIGKKAFLWGAVCGIVPDFDVAFVSFFETTRSLFVHRGISHSLFFIMVLSPLLGYILYKINKRQTYSLAGWTNLAFWAMITHSVLDVFTVYGTGFFEPFLHKRYAISSIAVVDLFFTIPLLTLAIIALLKKDRKMQKLYSGITLFVAVLYIAFTLMNKLYIQAEFETELTKNEVSYDRTEIFPVPPTNLLWNCLAQDRDGYWQQYKSNVSEYDTKLYLYMRNDYELLPIANDAKLQNLQVFSRDYYSIIPVSDSILLFRDLRFGKAGIKEDSPFIFQFKILHNNQRIISVQKQHPDLSSLF